MKSDINVLLAVPTYTARPHVACMMSLIGASQLLMQRRVRHDVRPVVGVSILALARNTLVHAALEGDFSHLLQIDDDMGFEPEAVLQLLAHGVDVVAGVCQVRGGGRYNLHNARQVPGSPLLSCDWVGPAFLLVARRCLMRLASEAPATDIPFAPKMVFDTAIIGGQLYSEDMVFCHRWRAMGERVFVDPAVPLWHFAGNDCLGKSYAAALADGTADPVLPAEEAAPQGQVPA
jgi:hypothetical protein